MHGTNVKKPQRIVLLTNVSHIQHKVKFKKESEQRN